MTDGGESASVDTGGGAGGGGWGWADAVIDRLSAAVASGGECEKVLPVGSGSGMVLENLGRLYADATGMDLGMVLPTLLAATSMATQGGWRVPMDLGTAGVKYRPLVFQFFGIAPSGQQKSTLLDRVVPALEHWMLRGREDRRELCVAWREQMEAKMTAPVDQGGKGLALADLDLKTLKKIFRAGICMSSMTSSGTPEGLRKKLVIYGGHRGIFTAEPDVLREINAFAKDGGSLTIFVGGWDQDTVSTDRAGEAHLEMPEASVPFAILTQPEPFEQYTAAKEGADPYMSRGVLSRVWVYQAGYIDQSAVQSAALAALSSPETAEQAQEALTMAQLTWEEHLGALVERSNEYRAAKAVMQAWSADPDAQEDIPMPVAPAMFVRRLVLDVGGRDVYRGVQRIRQGIVAAVAAMEIEEPGIRSRYDALCSRFTDHALRIAGLLTLADNPKAVVLDSGHLRDAAERWLPWLMAAWARAVTARGIKHAEAAAVENILSNPTGVDLTMSGTVLKALYSLYEKRSTLGPKFAGPSPDEGMTVSQMYQVARRYGRGLRRDSEGSMLRDLLESTCKAMVSDATFLMLGNEVTDATGITRQMYRLTEVGQQRARRDHEKQERKQGADIYGSGGNGGGSGGHGKNKP